MTNNLFSKLREFLWPYGDDRDPLEEFIVICDGKVWEDHYPSIAKLNSMCKEYPALNSSFEKFKTSWDLVINDWESKNE